MTKRKVPAHLVFNGMCACDDAAEHADWLEAFDEWSDELEAAFEDGLCLYHCSCPDGPAHKTQEWPWGAKDSADAMLGRVLAACRIEHDHRDYVKARLRVMRALAELYGSSDLCPHHYGLCGCDAFVEDVADEIARGERFLARK